MYIHAHTQIHTHTHITLKFESVVASRTDVDGVPCRHRATANVCRHIFFFFLAYLLIQKNISFFFAVVDEIEYECEPTPSAQLHTAISRRSSTPI